MFENSQFNVRTHYFEVPNEYIENDWDISDSVMTKSEYAVFHDSNQLDQYLHSVGSCIAHLQPARQTDYPL